MKRKYIKGFMLAILLLAGVMTINSVQCQAKTVNKFVTKAGKTYFYGENGKKVKNKLYEAKKGRLYYFDKEGVLQKGWQKINGEYYFFSRNSGKMYVKQWVDGIYVHKNGTVNKSTYNISKIKTMIKARKIVDSITNATDSKGKKLKKCFNWIMKFPYRRYRTLKPLYKTKGWEITFANDIFDKKAGCCVSEASALAFLIHECGFRTVYIGHDTGHAWVELNGRVYDPLFAEAKGYSKYFNRSYNGYGMYPVDKVNI